MLDDFLGPFLTAIAVGLYGALHSLMARPSVKQKVIDLFGSTGRRYYRIFYNFIGGVTFLPVLLIVAIFPGKTIYQLSWPWTIFSTSIQIAAIIFLFVGLLQTDLSQFLGVRQILRPDNRGNERLAIHGLYKWVRHPLYTAGLLFIWFTPIMTASVLLMNLSLTIYIYIGSIFEEQRLVEEFGEAYVRYKQSVPRLIPRPPRRVD